MYIVITVSTFVIIILLLLSVLKLVMKITIKEGILANFKADVIVNSTNQALLLDLGGLSHSILESAGPGLQNECSMNYPNGINFGELAVTGGHGLKCQRVYHVSIAAWDSMVVEPALVLGEVLTKCLEQAHQEKMTSIAFPTLGCGFLGHPPGVVADTIKQCVQTFELTHYDTTLTQLFFVVFTKSKGWKNVKKVFEDILLGASRNVRITRSTMRRLAHVPEVQQLMDISEDSLPERSDNACDKTLSCGHYCFGFKNETSCPPCLQPGCGATGCGQTGSDDCIICYTEQLSEAPIIQLKCGHVFHLHCTKRILENRWVGARISFNFILCPICKEPMDHPELIPLLIPIKALYDDVMRKAMMRLQYEGLEKSDAITNINSPHYNRPEQYAMERYCYYQCYKCNKPYFGGAAQCEEGAVAEVKMEELICPPCSGPQIAQSCGKHGTDFIEYKCRYCCTVAVYYCFGTTHFCNSCHTQNMLVRNMASSNTLPQCPAGPCGKQLNGACPLGIQHVPNGTECCLGCGLCSNLQTF